jgi:uncharacterized protein
VARLPSDSSLSLPVMVIHGRRPGPVVWLDAAVHGDELNGVEIIRQVLPRLKPREIAGTVVAVPIVNVFGFLNGTRYLPDRRDLNRSFPGSLRGSLTAQLAHLFVTEVVTRCDVGLDFHTGSDHRTNLAQLRVDLGIPEVARLAEAFSPPVVVDANQRDGSLRTLCSKLGIPLLVYEGGEALRFNDGAIRAGVEGTLRVLGALEMVRDNVVPPPAAEPPVIVRHSRWERARRSGILRIDIHAGQRVAKGEALGEVGDALGQNRSAVRASTKGLVLGYTRSVTCNQGDALVHLADLSESAKGGVARPPR